MTVIAPSPQGDNFETQRDYQFRAERRPMFRVYIYGASDAYMGNIYDRITLLDITANKFKRMSVAICGKILYERKEYSGLMANK